MIELTSLPTFWLPAYEGSGRKRCSNDSKYLPAIATYFPFLTPYFDRCCLRPSTPAGEATAIVETGSGAEAAPRPFPRAERTATACRRDRPFRAPRARAAFRAFRASNAGFRARGRGGDTARRVGDDMSDASPTGR